MKTIAQIKQFMNKTNKHNDRFITLWKSLLSEFLGTFLLCIAITSLFIYISSNGNPIIYYFQNQILVGIYSIFVMLLLFIFFAKWSCDLNPGITFYKLIMKKDEYSYGLLKIVVQFFAAFFAGIIIWSITQNDIKTAINVSSLKNALGSFVSVSSVNAFFWELFVETFLILMLLWSYFSDAISNKYRNMMIAFIFGLATIAGLISGNSMAINPARGISQQIPALLSGNINSGLILSTTFAILLSGITAPLVYILLKAFTLRYLNSFLIMIIQYKTHIFYHPKNTNNDSKKTKKDTK